MRIRLTVWAGRSSTVPRAVTMTMPPRCPPEELRSGRVAARLSDALGVPGDALCVRDQILDDAAVLGLPPILDGASVRLVERAGWNRPQHTAAVAATELAVVGGPDAGLSRALTAGTHTVGRAGADLTLADPSLSRHHLRLQVGPAGVTATDLDSENGTRADGVDVQAGVSVGVGTMLSVGHTRLTVRASRVHPATTTPRGDGTLLLARSPRPIPPTPSVRIDVPAPPDPPPARRMPWPAALMPLPIAGLLAWLFGPHLLLLAVMSPLMLLGSYLSDRIGARKSHRDAVRRHAEQVAACRQRRTEALEAERRWRERTYPDLAVLARAATTPGSLVWSRGTAESLIVRIGLGQSDSAVEWVEAGSAQRLSLDAAPVTVDLRRYAGLAVSGPLTGRVVDAILGQLCVLHSPRDLRLWTDRAGWAPAPHTRVAPVSTLVADVVAVLAQRSDPADRHLDAATSTTLVIAITTASLTGDDIAALAPVIERGGEAGIHLILAGETPALLSTTLETRATGGATFSSPGEQPRTLSVDGVGSEWVGRVAAALAPLRDTAAAGDLPTSVALTQALAQSGIEPTPEGIAQQWARADGGVWVTLGLDQHGTCGFDLAAAGPHALVAGTTGSGKSELLRTLVTSLAAAHPPEDVAVVLIDYKGGSAFTGLAALPHIVGVVTDLDGGLTVRALASLRAEIHRREGLYARCGASDLRSYRDRSRRAGADLPHLARLVIVVDEFRALVDELPDFVTGLVRLAAVGRSLGIHLVLATQRPAGVVTADMRANLGLRIALRVRDRTDSQDVIESDAAARLPRSTPGRALLRAGAEPLIGVQVATVEPPQTASHLTVEIAWSDGTSTARHYPLTTPAEDADLVETIATAARRGHHSAPPSPWLPPLSSRIDWRPTLPRDAWAIADDPSTQRQDPIGLDPATMAHTALAGGVGSGRTTTLLTMAAAVLAGHPRCTHVYALADPTGALSGLTGLAHTGALVDRSDPAQVAALVDGLAAAVRARQNTPATALMLVLVDGWDVLADACDALDHGALTDRLLATLREGYAVGLRAIITGDRSVLTGRVGRTVTERVMLRPGEPADLALAGIPPTSVPSDWPPGRGLRVGDRMELQVLTRRIERDATTPPAQPPWRLVPLPARVRLAALPQHDPGALAIGLGSDSDEPVTVGLAGRRRVLVVGSAGSGRSATLATIAVAAARAERPVALIDDEHSCLADLVHATGSRVEQLRWQDCDDLIALRRAHPDLVVVADDVDRHADSALVPVLTQISDLTERDGGVIAVAGDGAALTMRARGVGVAVARARFGVVLGAPTTMDGDLLGTRLPRVRQIIPGRGWLVSQRTAVPVQIAHPGGDGPSAPQHVPSIPRRHR